MIEVRASRSANGWRFEVTVRHGDTGWEHYADAWRVVGPDGAILGRRTLLHPHVGEQPFPRPLSGVAIPAGGAIVPVQAHGPLAGRGGVGAGWDVPGGGVGSPMGTTLGQDHLFLQTPIVLLWLMALRLVTVPT